MKRHAGCKSGLRIIKQISILSGNFQAAQTFCCFSLVAAMSAAKVVLRRFMKVNNFFTINVNS